MLHDCLPTLRIRVRAGSVYTPENRDRSASLSLSLSLSLIHFFFIICRSFLDTKRSFLTLRNFPLFIYLFIFLFFCLYDTVPVPTISDREKSVPFEHCSLKTRSSSRVYFIYIILSRDITFITPVHNRILSLMKLNKVSTRRSSARSPRPSRRSQACCC